MGKTNEEAAARAEEERFDFNVDSRRSGFIGSESESSWHKQERTNRASSQESSFYATGTSVAGGMIDHLIDDYDGQVAIKEEELIRKKQEVQRISDELKRLKSKVQEFKALKQELKKQLEEDAS